MNHCSNSVEPRLSQMNPRMSDRASSLLLVGREYLILGLAAVVIIAAVLLAAYGVHIYLGLNWFFSFTTVINGAAALAALVIVVFIAGFFSNPFGMITIFLYGSMLVTMLAGAAMFGAYQIIF